MLSDIARHLEQLGVGPAVPVPPEFWSRYPGAREDLRWLVDNYAGASFSRLPGTEVDGEWRYFGAFLTPDEMERIVAWTVDSLPRGLLPIEEDPAGNLIVVEVGMGGTGRVLEYVHDAPRDRNLTVAAESLEEFMLSLRRAED
ncbi:MAG: SMI1/KNR4 family protein [Marmoricola sp.]